VRSSLVAGLTTGVESHSGHRVHVGFGNVLYHDWNVKIPCPYCFIVRGRYEAAIFVHEGDGVDRAEMLIILLGNFTGIYVILSAC
jgi:hypothetical protein